MDNISFLNKCVLYGAGINSYGVMKYIGKEKVVGIIDSNPDRIGNEIDGVKVIHLESYIRDKSALPIVISAYQRSHEVIRILEENGLHNYLITPYLQGSVTEIQEITDSVLKESNGRKLVFDDTINIMTPMIIGELYARGRQNVIRGCLSAANPFVKDYYGLEQISEKEWNTDDWLVITKEDFEGKEADFPAGFRVSDCMYYNRAYRNERLLKFKNLYYGKRCFVIGNGPSLRMQDLDTLAEKREICFASNRIYTAFADTVWRPDYYVITDFVRYMECYEQIKNFDGNRVFMRRFYNMLDKDYIPGANIYNSPPQKEIFKFSDDIAEAVYSGLTVTYNMLQIAAYMGFQEIYLLGVDFSFSTDGKSNHFSEKYEKDSKIRDIFYGKENLAAYQAAEDFSHTAGFRIYNATRGGKLEVFERVDFDELTGNGR